MSLFLGTDTSNYTTSAAVYDSESGEMLQRKKLLPVKEGQLGMRQSEAVFHHIIRLHSLIGELSREVDLSKIAAVGASSRPRPVKGSYMPCFKVGENTARTLSSVLNVPMLEFSHQEGHIAAALYSAGRDDLFGAEFIAFHVSGGTTEAVRVSGVGDGFLITPAAKSLDLNAGQAVDRVGLMLGLAFPCGAELEKLALENTEEITVHPKLKGCDFCLSGVENLCARMSENGAPRSKTAAFCIEYIGETLLLAAETLLKKFGDLPIVCAGGVMSDSIIRERFEKRFNAVFAQPCYSTDNAAGIAYLTYRKFKNVYA